MRQGGVAKRANAKMPSVPLNQHFTLILMHLMRCTEFLVLKPSGVYRGKTYGHVLSRADYYAINVKNKNKSMLTDFRSWVEWFHEIDQDGVIQIRDAPLVTPLKLLHPRHSHRIDCEKERRRSHLKPQRVFQLF